MNIKRYVTTIIIFAEVLALAYGRFPVKPTINSFVGKALLKRQVLGVRRFSKAGVMMSFSPLVNGCLPVSFPLFLRLLRRFLFRRNILSGPVMSKIS